MNRDDDDDTPWTEERWERFLQESEAKSAKFGELLETLMDHPDRDAIIEREMGWDKPEDDEGDAEGEEPFVEPEIDPEMEAEIAEEIRARDEALEKLPAYRRGFDFALKVEKALRPCLDEQADKETDDTEDVGEAFINAHIIAVKIAGAHTMGYEEQFLCGNIVRCKKSLEAADTCIAALERLRERQVFPAEVLDPLLTECREVRELVAQHIADLRSRVWWQ